MLKAFTLILVLLIPSVATAQRVALTPQNRVHAGVSMVDMSAWGLAAGLDSRLTRIISVDTGAFLSPAAIEMEFTSDSDPASLVFLRHGMYVTPGLRIPHHYGEGVNWDFTLRGGFAAVWSTDVSHSTDTLQADPSLLGGADFLLRKDSVGLRASGKGFFYKPFSKLAREELMVLRPQLAVEVFYQW